ncbi:MAG: beta-eliminating lyase-related protein [Ruthenibacterium sp.]
MLYFDSDYMEGAHPEILRRLSQSNLEQNPGYGADKYCESAREKIRAACACPQAGVSFLVGGTQTNAVILDALLHRCEGVIAAETGHVNGHEAGAIEAGGHKVLALRCPRGDGKLDAQSVADYAKRFYADENHEHIVPPGAVYLSQPTECGTVYTKAELFALRAVCDTYHLALFADGARLGYALAAPGNDVTLPVLAEVCDAFYIGGTKVGALFGEAVVLPNPARVRLFFTLTKRHGALLAKGFLLGLQFDALFTDNLYERIAANAVHKAQRIRTALREKGYVLTGENPTNQIFILLPDDKLKALQQNISFGFWEKPDDAHTVVRIATSWATTDQSVDKLIALL